jgi:cytochrome b subunit of formate dehydrogenase
VNDVTLFKICVTLSGIIRLTFVLYKTIQNLKFKNMKKLIFLLAIAGLFMQANAQEQKVSAKDVPAAVTTAFYKANPTIKDVDWSKTGINYVGGYEVDKVANSITYNVSGKLIESQTEIVSSALPTPAMNYVKLNYKEDEVKKAYKVTDANDVVTYKAQVKGKDLTFDSNGNFINSIKN